MKKIRKIRIIIFSALLLIVYNPCFLSAQELQKDDFLLFGSEDMMEISLRFDISKFLKEKSQEEYFDAVLTYNPGEADSLINYIRLRARGNSRLEMCNFPPVRLNFKDCENRPIDLEGISNVKLITHCSANKVYEEYILKEYMAYKLYNLVSDYSFRVRLLKINYIDTGKKKYNKTLFGVLIEPLDLLEKRLNVLELENIVIRPSFLDPASFDKLCMFQFMIGNEDWFLANLHNLKIVDPQFNQKEMLHAIPYDFDYSGLVNAVYAVPNERYGLENIQDRIYTGLCRTDMEFRKLMDVFYSKKNDFYSEITKCEYFSEKTKKKLNKYLDSYFNLYKKDYILIKMKKTCIESRR